MIGLDIEEIRKIVSRLTGGPPTDLAPRQTTSVLAAPVDQRDQPGHAAGVDVPGEHAPEPLDPAVGEVAHGYRT